MERYYPVKTADGRFEARYKEYAALAENDPHLTFIGRYGTYQYLDMHMAIGSALSMWSNQLATP